MKSIVLLTCFVLYSFVFSSCATLTKDESQPVAFSSEPQGAQVSVNSMPMGTTPTTIMVKRKMGTTMIDIYKEGYHRETFPLDKSVAAMTFGNIIFGGFIGLGVDVATGKATDYQNSVHISLRPLPETLNDETKSNSKPKGEKGKNSDKQDAMDFKRRLMKRYSDGEITEEQYLEMLKNNESK